MRLFILVFMMLGQPAWGETVTGIIFGAKEVTIKAQSQGVIVQIHQEEGAKVKEGGLLAIIDDRQEVIERDLASAEFHSATADYQSTKKLGKYVSKEEIRQKKDNFLRKKSNLALKEFNLSNTKITTPITGVVSKSYFEKGETVSTGDKVFEVVRLDKLKMFVYIPAPDLEKIMQKTEFKFKTKTHGDREFTAKMGFVSPIIDSASGTVKIRLDIENIQAEGSSFVLKPGSMAYLEY